MHKKEVLARCEYQACGMLWRGRMIEQRVMVDAEVGCCLLPRSAHSLTLTPAGSVEAGGLSSIRAQSVQVLELDTHISRLSASKKEALGTLTLICKI
jgi:hypothetical protein